MRRDGPFFDDTQIALAVISAIGLILTIVTTPWALGWFDR